jgi:hypothetical protein
MTQDSIGRMPFIGVENGNGETDLTFYFGGDCRLSLDLARLVSASKTVWKGSGQRGPVLFSKNPLDAHLQTRLSENG